MMKRLFSSMILFGCVVGVSEFSALPLHQSTAAHAQISENLFYTYFGKQIPLTGRSDAIAVAFKAQPQFRGSQQPLHLKLKQDLQFIGTRGETPQKVEVQPIGNRYALIIIPSSSRPESATALQQRIAQQNYVESTLPVLSRSNTGNNLIILPNEIVVSFQPELSDTQIKTLLQAQNLEIIRPLQFSQKRYLVKSRNATGVAVLNISNHLNKVPGVVSATPNFVQSIRKG
jgi:hypothetical protein